jgi:hypothetical protein
MRMHNIRTDAREIGYKSLNWINFDQARMQWPAFVHTAMNLQVTSQVGNVVTI